jgi:hypothetical protein
VIPTENATEPIRALEREPCRGAGNLKWAGRESIPHEDVNRGVDNGNRRGSDAGDQQGRHQNQLVLPIARASGGVDDNIPLGEIAIASKPHCQDHPKRKHCLLLFGEWVRNSISVTHSVSFVPIRVGGVQKVHRH